MDWIHNCALKDGLIKQEDVELFTITDDVDEALRLLKDATHKHEVIL